MGKSNAAVRNGVILALLVTGGPAVAGEEGVWGVVADIRSTDKVINILVKETIFKGCETFKLDIVQARFKWGVVAKIGSSKSPKQLVPIEILSESLKTKLGSEIYFHERTPLKKLDSCHFLADGVSLDGEYLDLFYKFVRL